MNTEKRIDELEKRIDEFDIKHTEKTKLYIERLSDKFYKLEKDISELNLNDIIGDIDSYDEMVTELDEKIAELSKKKANAQTVATISRDLGNTAKYVRSNKSRIEETKELMNVYIEDLDYIKNSFNNHDRKIESHGSELIELRMNYENFIVNFNGLNSRVRELEDITSQNVFKRVSHFFKRLWDNIKPAYFMK